MTTTGSTTAVTVHLKRAETALRVALVHISRAAEPDLDEAAGELLEALVERRRAARGAR